MVTRRNLSEEVLALREEGLSYSEICIRLNCSKGTVSYYLGRGQKEKTIARKKKSRQKSPLYAKLNKFNEPSRHSSQKSNKARSIDEILSDKIIKYSYNKGYKPTVSKRLFSLSELRDKIGDNPRCYITGVEIDLLDSQAYSLDHIIPRSKGGENSLDNCGLASKAANQMKSDMTLEELHQMCRLVLEQAAIAQLAEQRSCKA